MISNDGSPQQNLSQQPGAGLANRSECQSGGEGVGCQADGAEPLAFEAFLALRL